MSEPTIKEKEATKKWFEADGDLDHYKRLATQRGARMQKIYSYICRWYCNESQRYLITHLITDHPEVKDWFDKDGVPVED